MTAVQIHSPGQAAVDGLVIVIVVITAILQQIVRNTHRMDRNTHRMALTKKRINPFSQYHGFLIQWTRGLGVFESSGRVLAVSTKTSFLCGFASAA